MPRSASPPYNFSVPSGTAAVSGAVISSVSYNAFLADLTNNALNSAWPIAYGGTGTTDGSALVPDGGAAAPAVRFQSETNSGVYYVSAGDIGISILGTKRVDITAAGLAVTGNVTATGTISGTNVTGYTSTATAAGTTTLLAASTGQQVFTGSLNQIVQMPVTTTLYVGQSWKIVNKSTGILTVNSSGSNLIQYIQAGDEATITCNAITGTTAASWNTQGPVARNRVNLFWNPAMAVSQQNGTTLGTTNGYFGSDSLAAYFVASAGAISFQNVAVTSLNGSPNQVQWKCTTLNSSPGATNFDTITGKIEGLDATQLRWGNAAAIPATVSFNFTGPAGTYNVHIQNNAGNRHIAIPFSPATANTEQRITVVVPGDITGTWTYAADTFCTMDFVLVAGSNFVGGSASTWSGSTFYASATQANSRSSTSNTINITDVQFSPDPDNTGGAPAWVPVDIGNATRDSQRYLRSYGGETNFDNMAIGNATSTVTATVVAVLSPSMRIGPSLLSVGSVAVTNGAGTPVAATGLSVNISTTQNCSLVATVAAGLTLGQGTVLVSNNTTAARMVLSSRLS